MLNGVADRRESCSLLELSHPNMQISVSWWSWYWRFLL